MEKFYTVKDLIKILKNEGIKISRPNIFVKIREGFIKPQSYLIMGKRKYPQYTKEYIDLLIGAYKLTKELDWDRVKNITDDFLAMGKAV